MSEFYDALETRDPQQRERDLFDALPAHLAHARDHAPHFRSLLDGVDIAKITSRDALATLPVTRKSEVAATPTRSL